MQSDPPESKFRERFTNFVKRYERHYSESNFHEKLTKLAAKAGKLMRNVLERGLTLFYTLRDTSTPPWARTVIIGALGYFIAPLDLIPDLIPAAGYNDDLLLLAAALGVVAAHIKEEHREEAKKTLRQWFGQDS